MRGVIPVQCPPPSAAVRLPVICRHFPQSAIAAAVLRPLPPSAVRRLRPLSVAVDHDSPSRPPIIIHRPPFTGRYPLPLNRALSIVAAPATTLRARFVLSPPPRAVAAIARPVVIHHRTPLYSFENPNPENYSLNFFFVVRQMVADLTENMFVKLH